jgi:hypothetical protein
MSRGRIDPGAALSPKTVMNVAVYGAGAFNGVGLNVLANYTLVPSYKARYIKSNDMLVLMHAGTMTGDHTLDFWLRESDDTLVWTDYVGPIRFENNVYENYVVSGKVDLEKRKQYQSARIVVGGTTPSIPFDCIFILCNPMVEPVWHPDGLLFNV